MAKVDGKPLSDSYFPGTGPVRCGIAPGGVLAGCDLVPAEPDVPAGANETVVDGSTPARYIHSDTTTFSPDVDELVPGHHIENGQALCRMGYPGTIHCEIGEHSFSLNERGATLI